MRRSSGRYTEPGELENLPGVEQVLPVCEGVTICKTLEDFDIAVKEAKLQFREKDFNFAMISIFKN